LYIHPYAKSLARELHDDAIIVEPEQRGPIAGKVVFEQYIGVAPRVYQQYFSFPTDRKDKRGRAMESPKPGEAVPRVLTSADTFAFGGPVVPASRISDLERDLIQSFEALVAATKGLKLPAPSDKEDER
jgi:hypothetical protein